jgi:hypothetical protein
MEFVTNRKHTEIATWRSESEPTDFARWASNIAERRTPIAVTLWLESHTLCSWLLRNWESRGFCATGKAGAFA